MSTVYGRMDDSLWDEVWERSMGHIERHNVALSVFRHEPPEDPFAMRIGFELAHRWRARARNLGVVYGLWTIFWAVMAYAGSDRVRPPGPGVPIGLATVGVVAVILCLAFHYWMRPIIQGRTGFRPGTLNGPAGPLGAGSE